MADQATAFPDPLASLAAARAVLAAAGRGEEDAGKVLETLAGKVAVMVAREREKQASNQWRKT